MSLENIQAGTNRQRVAAGNVSASNDPTQWGHDGREQLIKGAELAAAGRTLGMSEEETLAAVSRQFRRQRRADDRLTETDVLRQMVQSAATVKETAPEELKGLRVGPELDTAWAQGEDIDYFREYGETRADDEQTIRPDDRGFTVDEVDGGIRRETFTEQKGQDAGPVVSMRRIVDPNNIFNGVTVTRYENERKMDANPAFAPNNVVRDALSRLQAGTQAYGYDMFPGAADAEGRLEAHLRNDIGADISLAQETVRRDKKRFNPEVEKDNYYAAEAEAIRERDRLYGRGGYGRKGDINLSKTRREPEIHTDWFKGEIFEKVFGPSLGIESEIARRHDGVYLDPVSGNPVAVQGPDTPPMSWSQDGGSNAGTADAANAPQTARSWLAQSLDQSLDQMKTSDRLEQVDITQATTTTANKIRDYYKKVGLENTARVPSNVRSVEELQRVVDRVLKATNGQLTVPDLVKGGGAQTGASGREVEAALTAIGMRPGEQRQLAQAMYQMDAARRSSVNENPTGIYLSRTGEQVQGPAMRGSQTRSFGDDGRFTSNVTFDAGSEIDEGMMKADVARIPRGSTIGVMVKDPKSGSSSVKRRNIVDQLSTLPSRDAAMPFMGQVVGEKPRVNRYTRTGQDDPVDAAIAIRKQAEERAKGGEVDAERTRGNQVRAMLITEREKRDNTSRAEAASELISQLPPNARRTRLGGRYS